MFGPEDQMFRRSGSVPRDAFIDLAIALADEDAEVELRRIHGADGDADAREGAGGDDDGSLIVELSLGGCHYELYHPDRESDTASLVCRLPQGFEALAVDTPHELLARNRSPGDMGGAGFALDAEGALVFIQAFSLTQDSCQAALVRTMRQFCGDNTQPQQVMAYFASGEQR